MRSMLNVLFPQITNPSSCGPCPLLSYFGSFKHKMATVSRLVHGPYPYPNWLRTDQPHWAHYTLNERQRCRVQMIINKFT